MEKIIAGRVILYRERCPECGEWNISENNKFECTWCSSIYRDQEYIKIRQLTNSMYKRKHFTKKQKEIVWERQDGHCYWCNRKFGTYYMKRSKVQKLKMHMDHRMPYSYLPNDNLKNICGACSICNQFKHNKIFNNIQECKKYLVDKWECAIDSKKIVIVT